jgi:signal transduction histidine kinase
MNRTPKIVFFSVFLIFFVFGAALSETIEQINQESIAKAQATANDKVTPQMIVDKVNQAAKLLENECTDAFPKFQGKDTDFIFAGTYIWVHDLEGVMRMHPIKYKMNDKRYIDLKDSNGKRIFVDMNMLAEKQGAGWYEYSWPKPGEKAPSPKVSYIKLVECGNGEKLVVGCGVYDMKIDQIQK